MRFLKKGRGCIIPVLSLVAIIDKDDAMHAEPKRLLDTVKKGNLTLITTDYVFDETITTQAGFSPVVLGEGEGI